MEASSNGINKARGLFKFNRVILAFKLKCHFYAIMSIQMTVSLSSLPNPLRMIKSIDSVCDMMCTIPESKAQYTCTVNAYIHTG